MTVPVNLTVTGTVNAPETRCYNATGTITVAGGGTSFLISSGGSATLIAGQKISFLPGTTVLSGGYMHGYITTNDQYCTNPTYPMVSSPEQKEATPSVEIPETVSASLRVYPNPAREMFTVEITGSTDDLITAIDVYSLNGLKISSFSDVNSRGFTLTSVGMTPGLYFIRVQTTNGVKTLKLIRN
jgi:hypothetical protein